jgi:hypothetical protein
VIEIAASDGAWVRIPVSVSQELATAIIKGTHPARTAYRIRDRAGYGSTSANSGVCTGARGGAMGQGGAARRVSGGFGLVLFAVGRLAPIPGQQFVEA